MVILLWRWRRFQVQHMADKLSYQARGPRYWCTPAFQYQCLRRLDFGFVMLWKHPGNVTLQFLDHLHFFHHIWDCECMTLLELLEEEVQGFRTLCRLCLLWCYCAWTKRKTMQGIIIKNAICLSIFLSSNLGLKRFFFQDELEQTCWQSLSLSLSLFLFSFLSFWPW